MVYCSKCGSRISPATNYHGLTPLCPRCRTVSRLTTMPPSPQIHKCYWCEREVVDTRLFHDEWLCGVCIKWVLQEDIMTPFILKITYQPRIAIETPLYGDGNGSPSLCETEYVADPTRPHASKIFYPIPDFGRFSPDEVDYDGTIDPAHPKIQILIEKPDVITKARIIPNIKPLLKNYFRR